MSWLKRNAGFVVFLLAFGFLRTAVADWNPIPSGSMRPTILEGDVVLVNRLAYDLKLPLTDHVLAHLGEPQRGDIVTFSSPVDGTRLIKRLVALPGDVVALRDGVLSVNGRPAHYEPLAEIEESAGNGALVVRGLRLRERTGDGVRDVQWLPALHDARPFGPVTVPAGHYFMLGDNRDDSHDSRWIGAVPRERLIGRAHHVLVSADVLGRWMPRLERFGAPLDPR